MLQVQGAWQQEDAAQVDLDPPKELDLRGDGIASVVWCTGFTGDFSWLDPTLVDDCGRPLRRDAAALALACGTSDCAGSSAAAQESADMKILTSPPGHRAC